MGLPVQVMMIILIAGSACCVLVGIIMTFVRIARLTRRERVPRNEIWTAQQIEEADSVQSRGCRDSDEMR